MSTQEDVGVGGIRSQEDVNLYFTCCHGKLLNSVKVQILYTIGLFIYTTVQLWSE